jgi:hypothetical protein
MCALGSSFHGLLHWLTRQKRGPEEALWERDVVVAATGEQAQAQPQQAQAAAPHR